MPLEQLLALTVALEDAVGRRDWPEVNVLFSERGQILDSDIQVDPSQVEAILRADARLHERLQAERSVLQTQLKQTRKVAAAQKLYTKLG